MTSISIHHYEGLIERFKNKEFGIEELQSRLNTAPPLPESIIPSKVSEELLHDLDNQLEMILYTRSEFNHYELVVNVLDSFINSLKKAD